MSNIGVNINSSLIISRRKGLGLSQEALSNKSMSVCCYISLSTIKRMELGKPVSLNTVNKVSKCLDLNIEEILSSQDA
ncbi:helix-turn-helix domain-containing protein [Thaumasiovibrio subtropicus]|uniref:helix-turn-helix domain-containing protein n=2 Tax=Thaumasiovibrio subtropicus TaxID=1891207 RepID=UPI001C852A55